MENNLLDTQVEMNESITNENVCCFFLHKFKFMNESSRII